MLKALKKLFGVKSADTPAEVPYKVETPLVQLGPEPTLMPAGTEASVAAPVPVAEAKPAKAPKVAKPKVEKAPAVKKPRATKKPKAE
jgi:hypothetical protein